MSVEPAQLRQGRLRHASRRKREAIARVAAYRAWLRAGGDVRKIPPLPSDHDFKLARRLGPGAGPD